MDTSEDIIQIKKSLEKMMLNEELDISKGMELLNRLKHFPMTLDILQKTRIGMAVNSVRKMTADEELNNLGKSLIKHWKKLVHDDADSHLRQHRSARRSRSSSSGSSRRDSITSTGSSNSLDDHAMDDSAHAGGEGNHLPPVLEVVHRTRSGPPVQVPKASLVKDPVRLKCREMLASALKAIPVQEVAVVIDDFAAAVEDCVFSEFHNTELKYKNRIRSRVANLRDPKNPRLHESVLLGEITPEHLATMTADEMASDEMRQVRANLAKEAFNDHQMTFVSGINTDQFQCSNCKKHNTTYNEMLSTNAEEPLTTFILCNDCGFRWKL